MKNFQNYTPEKYKTADYQEVEAGIYKTKSPYGSFGNEEPDIFVTSLLLYICPLIYGNQP